MHSLKDFGEIRQGLGLTWGKQQKIIQGWRLWRLLGLLGLESDEYTQLSTIVPLPNYDTSKEQ